MATMTPNSDDNYEKKAATTARVTTTVARVTVTGAKRGTTAMMVTTATMATMATMTPNSDNAVSGKEGNKDTKRWQRQQKQWRMMAIINPAEAQDTAIMPTAAPR
jgi:hypothetical protein